MTYQLVILVFLLVAVVAAVVVSYKLSKKVIEVTTKLESLTEEIKLKERRLIELRGTVDLIFLDLAKYGFVGLRTQLTELVDRVNQIESERERLEE